MSAITRDPGDLQRPTPPFSTVIENKDPTANRPLGRPCVAHGWPLGDAWVALAWPNPNPKPNPNRQRVAVLAFGLIWLIASVVFQK